MKVKELNLTANIAWAPKCVTTPYIACGTSSQQIDTSTAGTSLQLYNLNLGETNLETKLVSSIPTPARFHQLTWGPNGNTEGFLAGGFEDKSIHVYDAAKILAGNGNALVISMENKHTGPVYDLDFNGFQSKLLASGSADSEIFIWDITKPGAPMTPGGKSNVSANVTCINWNKQVEHILAATYGDRCVVYDLRKNSSIVHISDSVSRIKPHRLAWHPTMATQLILSSDNDQTPVAQVWDLRYSTAPIKTLSGHQRGIIASAWCAADSDIFITSGKDNRILVWNPNQDKNGEIIGEFPSYNQWSFDLSICNKDPSLVATTSIDGTVSVYSLIGGGLPPTQTDKFSAIADSFPGMEIPSAMPQTAEAQPIQLKNPPKWVKKPCGVRFVFGGRTISWNSNSKAIEISQVVTEPEFVNRSHELEAALTQQDIGAYCSSKAEAATSEDQILWQFIGANFSPDTLQDNYIELLGYNKTGVAEKVRPDSLGPSPDELVNKIATLSTTEGSTSSLDPSEQFEMIASAHSADKTPEPEIDESIATKSAVLLDVSDSPDGMIRHALLVGDFESAIQLCIEEKSHSLALMLAIHAGGEVYYKTRDKILALESSNQASSLVGALVQHDLTSLVTSCDLDNWKEALVALLTYASNEEFSPLAEILGERLENYEDSSRLHHAMICYICAGALNRFVKCWVKTQPGLDTSPDKLQDLVEIVMVLEKALNCTGHVVNLSEDEGLSQRMCQYASLLAAQGALTTASTYLTNATQGEMLNLRERVYKALGYQVTTNQTSVPARVRTASTHSNASLPLSRRASSNSQTLQPTPFTPMQPQPQASPNVFNPGYGQPAGGQLCTNFGGASSFGTPAQDPTFGSHQQPTFGAPSANPSMMMPTPPSVTAPPTGPSGGLRRAGGGGRYISDSSSSPNPQTTMFNPTNPQYNVASIQPYNPAPPMAAFNPGMPPHSNINPGMPTQPINQPPMGLNPPPMGLNPMTPGVMPGAQNPPNTIDGQYTSQSSVTPAAHDASIPRGWNDPPPLITKKNKQPTQPQPIQDQIKPMQPVQPIMNPVIGTQPQPQFQGFQPPPPQGHSPAPFQAPQPSAPVEKTPIPAEHQIIQEVLDGIKCRALMTVQNMMAKQRLENIGPKIEVLYDKLRAGQVSATTLSGLHDIVESVKSGDYHRALQIHTNTVATGNFSEMSQYMPPLKMLLTTCMQFQVFLQ